MEKYAPLPYFVPFFPHTRKSKFWKQIASTILWEVPRKRNFSTALFFICIFLFLLNNKNTRVSMLKLNNLQKPDFCSTDLRPILSQKKLMCIISDIFISNLTKNHPFLPKPLLFLKRYSNGTKANINKEKCLKYKKIYSANLS